MNVRSSLCLSLSHGHAHKTTRHSLQSLYAQAPLALDLANYETAASLEALGLDRLKAALMAAGIKCGGTFVLNV